MSICPALYDELAGRTPVTTDPFRLRTDLTYSARLGGQRRSILSALIAARMIDTHDALIRAWRALHSGAGARLPAAQRDSLLAQLVAPPCTEAGLLQLAATTWKDQIRHTALVERWQDDALALYQRVAAQAEGGAP
jgi:hypothetical protein